tara:strand:+ start:13621 stop:14178 length:558 start_codon:yes stop_codon:yes gene_type:complete
MNFQHTWHLNHSVCEIVPLKYEDNRGFFSETYKKNIFEEIGITEKFVQENLSFSRNKYTFRGLHFQRPPFEQAKLVRVLKGSILDIAVDLRSSSPTYLQHVSLELSALNFKQLFIPAGFAHGFLTLEENCEIAYKISNYYNEPSDTTVSVFDKDIEIRLPCEKNQITFSSKDADAQSWKSIGEIF